MRTFVVLVLLWAAWEAAHDIHRMVRRSGRHVWTSQVISYDAVPRDVHGSFGDASHDLICSDWTCPTVDDVSGSPGDDGR